MCGNAKLAEAIIVCKCAARCDRLLIWRRFTEDPMKFLTPFFPRITRAASFYVCQHAARIVKVLVLQNSQGAISSREPSPGLVRVRLCLGRAVYRSETAFDHVSRVYVSFADAVLFYGALTRKLAAATPGTDQVFKAVFDRWCQAARLREHSCSSSCRPATN